jgi:hypothetical protein
LRELRKLERAWGPAFRAPFISGTGEMDYGVPGAAKNTGA